MLPLRCRTKRAALHRHPPSVVSRRPPLLIRSPHRPRSPLLLLLLLLLWRRISRHRCIVAVNLPPDTRFPWPRSRAVPPRLASWLDAQRRRYGPYVTTAIAGGRTTVATTRGVVQLGIIGHRVRQLNLIGIDWSGVTTAEIVMDKNVDDNDGDNDDDCNGQRRWRHRMNSDDDDNNNAGIDASSMTSDKGDNCATLAARPFSRQGAG